MSRVDEAWRQAQFQPSGGPVSISVEPEATVVGDSALDRRQIDEHEDIAR